MTTTTRTETRKRGFFGWIFLIVFWLFNAFMLFAIFAGINGAADHSAAITSEAEKAGAAIGTAIGIGMILGIWAFGALILGLLMMATRGKKIIVETVS